MARLMAQILIFRFRQAAGLLWLCLIAAAPAAAQYRFDHWTTDNGLPQNTVRAIVQTRDGYLWLTTFDGLARFDGVRFTVFNKSNTPAITNNRLTALYEDKDGTLWIGADQGEVVSYRAGVFKSYASAEGPRGATIGDFRRDFNDELMIITAGAYYLRAGKFIPAPAEYSDPKLRLYRGPSGSRWTIDARGVRQVKDGRETYYPIKFEWDEGIGGLDAYEDSQGNLWVGDWVSVYRLRDGQVTRYTAADGLPRMILRPQCEDDDGGVWFSTGAVAREGFGVVRFKDGRFTIYGRDTGLPKTIYNQFVKDREGSIWIAAVSGLHRVRKELITSYSTAHGLAHNEVYPLLQTRNGDIWVGTIHGASLFRNGSFAGNPLPGFTQIVQSFWEDRAGRLWIGAWESLHRYENGRLKTLTPLLGGAALVWAIREDRTGAVWVATHRGLFKFEGDKVAAHYTTKDGLPSDDVKVIHESVGESEQSVMWFGTYGGLARFRDGQFISYTTAEGLAGNRVRSLYEDADGALWIGTYDDGLSRLRNGRFFNYRTEQGLYNNGVFQILEDRRGNFWISCNKSIYRVSRRELNDLAEGRIARVSSVAFGKQDGMLNSECNGGRQPAGLVTPDGRLWFPTMGGVVVIDPEAAQPNPQPPPVKVESVMLERGPVDFRERVTVAPGQRDLEINYTGLSLFKSEQVKFKYKLEGLDADWVDVGTRRVAYFPYLPPGSYRFRVIAANSDGVWNNEGAALDIFVATPFYRAWWFITLVALGVVGITLLIYQRRLATLRMRQAAQEAFSRQLIESQEAERKRIAAELHDSLGQHLLIIRNRAALGERVAQDHPTAKEQFDEITASATQAITEVRAISHNLRPLNLERLGLTAVIEEMIENVAASSGIQFSADIEPLDGLLAREGEISCYRIIQESVNNIIKHSRATKAYVEIWREGGELRITVRDNGRGFGAETMANGAAGGLGLTSISERVRLLGGAHTIHSAPAQGTTLQIRIPFAVAGVDRR